MGKIFYVMGKSASGKDTIFKRLCDRLADYKTVKMYTTRPIRDGERNGVEYYFVDQAFLEETRRNGTLIECRTYQTVYGPWSYFTVDDGQIDLEHGNYLMMGTLESYEELREYYGHSALVPVYVYVEDGLRLERAIAREREQAVPKYKELCRRFLADEEDFKEENLRRCGITEQYENLELEACIEMIARDILAQGAQGAEGAGGAADAVDAVDAENAAPPPSAAERGAEH